MAVCDPPYLMSLVSVSGSVGHVIVIGNIHLKNTLDNQIKVKNEFDKFGCIMKIWIGKVCAILTYDNADSAVKAIQVIKIRD